MVITRRTLRKAAVTFLSVGCFLSASVTAATVHAVEIAGGSPPVAATEVRCATAPPAPTLAPGEAGADLLWAQEKLGLSEAGVWYLNRGKNVTVAVLDTGVDPSNPVFTPNAVLPGPSVVDPGGSADYDCDGHGTAVAAIIAGRQSGLFGFTGVAPEAKILPIRVAGDANRAATSVQLANAIRTAVAAGARIVNISVGVPDDSAELRSAVRNALAGDVLIVAAVGAGPDRSYPAALPGVLAVGAIDAKGSAASFGQAPGVMVSAPGGRMAVPAAGYPNQLTTMEGTGLAVPFVSGTAALVLSYRPNLHNWQVVKRLEATSDQPADPASPTATPTSPNPQTGYGVVDPYRAVSQDLPDERRPDPSAGPGDVLVPAEAAVPGHDGGASRLALGVSAAALLALAAPVGLAAARRGRVKGPRAGV